MATGSVMARVPLPTFSSYAASKHALQGFLNSLRIELRSAKLPVKVSMVHPGAVGHAAVGPPDQRDRRAPPPRVLGVVARLYPSGRDIAPIPGSVFAPSGDGEASGGGPWARPSLWAHLRLRDP